MRRLPRFILLLALAVLLHGCGLLGQNEMPPLVSAADPRHQTGDDGIVLLGAEWCGYCKQLRAEFDQADVDYLELDVDTDAGDAALKSVRSRIVPVTIIGQRVIVGYDIYRIRELLAPLGYRL
ncbi:MAG: glutaredoxin family protein [Xanthomonadales bacterium]|nr:glutaredoxin family protein [Xanthomonadales bacterium]